MAIKKIKYTFYLDEEDIFKFNSKILDLKLVEGFDFVYDVEQPKQEETQ